MTSKAQLEELRYFLSELNKKMPSKDGASLWCRNERLSVWH